MLQRAKGRGKPCHYPRIPALELSLDQADGLFVRCLLGYAQTPGPAFAAG